MSREKGREYEKRACEFLINEGFEIIECNFYSRFGEIDIIAYKEGVLHFVEVKGSERYESIYAITPKKLQKIIHTIDFYLSKNSITSSYCIDAIAFKGEEVVYIPNITL